MAIIQAAVDEGPISRPALEEVKVAEAHSAAAVNPPRIAIMGLV